MIEITRYSEKDSKSVVATFDMIYFGLPVKYCKVVQTKDGMMLAGPSQKITKGYFNPIGFFPNFVQTAVLEALLEYGAPGLKRTNVLEVNFSAAL